MATPTSVQFQGLELQNHDMSHPFSPGQFCRIIRVDNRVWIRHGTRGTEGTHTDTGSDFISNVAAADFVRAERRQWEQIDGYEVLYTTSTPCTLDVIPTDPEAAFLAMWGAFVRSTTTLRVAHATAPPPAWVLVTGLARERELSHGAAQLHTALTTHIHAVDPHVDRLVAYMPRPPFAPSIAQGTGHVDHVGFGVYAMPLGLAPSHCAHATPACASCLQFNADLLVSLSSTLNPARNPVPASQLPALQADVDRVRLAAARLVLAGAR